MNAAMGHLGQQAEARRIVVKQRKGQQHGRYKPPRHRQERTETDFMIETFLDLLRLFQIKLVQISRAHSPPLPASRMGILPCHWRKNE